MSITRIEASGDAYAVGRAVGEATSAAIRLTAAADEEFTALERRWRGSAYVAQLLDAARAAFPRYVRELEGMAEGAETEFERLFVWNCRGDLGLPDAAADKEAAAAADGCTTVLLPAGEDGGAAVIGHNEDGAPAFHGHCFWVSARSEDGEDFESFLYPGMLAGHSFGVNSAGLVQTINNLRVGDLKPGVPRHFIARAVLDCATLGEATAVLQRSDRASGFHHNLGRAGEPGLLSVEAPAGGCHVRAVEAPRAHANHLIEAPFADLPQVVTESSKARQDKADKLLAEGACDGGDPTPVLFDRTDAGSGRSIHRRDDGGDDYGTTLATGVFRIRADGVDWTVHDGPDAMDLISGRVGGAD